VTPVDEAGNTCLIVVVVFYTKYVWATPAKEKATYWSFPYFLREKPYKM